MTSAGALPGRKLDAASYRAMRWKNGGGTTTEIARSPAGDSLDDFDWRVSMAQVASPGPFSRFGGVDRSIAVLEGDGITLRIEGRGETRLDPGSPPFAFPADIAVTASLAGGAIDDFNVMTRRGRWRHLLTRARHDANVILPCLGDTALVFVVAGRGSAALGGVVEALGPRDALLFARGEALELAPAPEMELLAVDLWRD